MQEIYSNDDDCFELFKLLKKNLGDKIDYYGTPYTALFHGKYFFQHRQPHSDIDYLFDSGILFYYKFCKNGFLRIQVGTSIHHNISIEERLSVLNDFYEVLSKKFGEPTVFYTTKNDDEELLSLHWSFINKEEDIQKFKNGTYFDDAEIDKLVIIDEQNQNMNECLLNNNSEKKLTLKI